MISNLKIKLLFILLLVSCTSIIAQNIFEVETSKASCINKDGTIKLTLIDDENPTYPLPYSVELTDENGDSY